MFTPEVIKAGFEKTGIFPWNQDLITKNEKINAGNSKEEEEDRAIKKMGLTLNQIMKESNEKENPKRIKVQAKRNYVYSSDELIKMHEEQEKERQTTLERREATRKAKEDEKNQKREQRKAKKRKREEEKEKDKKIQSANYCKKCSKRYKNGSEWYD